MSFTKCKSVNRGRKSAVMEDCPCTFCKRQEGFTVRASIRYDYNFFLSLNYSVTCSHSSVTGSSCPHLGFRIRKRNEIFRIVRSICFKIYKSRNPSWIEEPDEHLNRVESIHGAKNRKWFFPLVSFHSL